MKSLAFVALNLLICLTFALDARAGEAHRYVIAIKRGSGTSGTLSCTEAGITNVACYWNGAKRIPAGKYSGCSTTIMANKGYKAVFIPDVHGFTGIFIHQGNGPNASDGCIVTVKQNVEKIWDAIPRDKKNITVAVADE